MHSRRESNKLDKRARILAAASELFAEQGFEATTLRAVAEHANVATGTLFLYAENKLDLAYQVFETWLTDAMREGEAAPATDTALESAMVVFTPFLARYAGVPKLARALIPQTIFLHGRSKEAYAALNFSFLLQLTQRLAACSDLRGAPPGTVAAHLFQLYLVQVLLFLQPEAPDLDHGVAVLRSSFAEYLQLVCGER